MKNVEGVETRERAAESKQEDCRRKSADRQSRRPTSCALDKLQSSAQWPGTQANGKMPDISHGRETREKFPRTMQEKSACR